MSTTKIEWTESTWNPVTGCTKMSSGCKNCYAERMAMRLKAMGQANYINGFSVTEHNSSLKIPLEWKKPKRIFVNSMSDLFHKDVSTSFINKIFDVMRSAPWHIFQILTKRSGRLKQLNSKIDWPSNVWMGVTVEEDKYKHRIDDLRHTSARIKFVSMEPLIGPIFDVDLTDIDWVIVGGESGPHSRPMDEDWVLDIKDCCFSESVPFFFKQWGGVNKKKNGRLLAGRTWNSYPQEIHV